VEFTWRGLELIVGNYYVLTLLVFIAATACALVLTRRLRPERAAPTANSATRRAAPDAVLTPCVINASRYNASRYYVSVLRSFKDRETEAIWHRQRSRLLDGPTQRVAWRKLAMLDAAETLADLRVPPGNRLEKLRGDREGQH
jgi:plasmid maintenance system killer protein